MSSALLVALLLGAAGTVLLALLLTPLIRAIGAFWNPIEQVRRYKIKKVLLHYGSEVSEIDRLLETRLHGQALSRVSNLFAESCFEPPAGFIESTTNLQLALVARLMNVAEGSGIHLPNIAVVEELIQERAQSLQALSDNKRMRQALKRKRAVEKKSMPEWAERELDTQFKQLQEKVRVNRTTLLKQLNEAVALVRDQAHRSRLTVH